MAWTGRRAGATVEHYRIQDGLHAWPGVAPGTTTIGATESTWRFFVSHPARPAPKLPSYRVAMRAEVLVVHGLDDSQRALAELFGTTTGDEVDKFAACSWRPGPQGAPVLADCPRWFAGQILDRTPWGNHTAFLLKPIEVAGGGGGRTASPMMLSHVTDLRPGHEA